jgi:hypothetical protein
MKLQKSATLLLGATLLTSVVFTSCKKENKTETADNNEALSDASTSEAKFENSENVADAALAGGGSTEISGKLQGTEDFFAGSCANVTRDTTGPVRKITIDFGTANCLCKDGVNRRGKMMIDHNGRYRNAGATHTITFDNFYEEDNKIEGTKTVTNNGLNGSGQMNWGIKVVGGKITYTDGTFASWESTRTRTQTAGQGTIGKGGWFDDEYDITGTGGGTSVKGVTYTAEIKTALHKKVKGCKRFVSGVLEIVPTGSSSYKRQIDFGNGACDNTAEVTVFRGNKTKKYTITFKK